MKELNNIPIDQPGPGRTDSTSLSLVRRLKLKQSSAWERMAELYAPVVFYWCRCAQLQAADADDVVQEVFRTVNQKIDSFCHDSTDHTFRGWLRTITRNKLGDFIRRQTSSAQAIGGTDGQLQVSTVPYEDASADDLVCEDFSQLYQRALDYIRVEFKPSSWSAFWNVVVDGQSVADTAEELGISTNAVHVAKSRILSRLREELGDI